MLMVFSQAVSVAVPSGFAVVQAVSLSVGARVRRYNLNASAAASMADGDRVGLEVEILEVLYQSNVRCHVTLPVRKV